MRCHVFHGQFQGLQLFSLHHRKVAQQGRRAPCRVDARLRTVYETASFDDEWAEQIELEEAVKRRQAAIQHAEHQQAYRERQAAQLRFQQAEAQAFRAAQANEDAEDRYLEDLAERAQRAAKRATRKARKEDSVQSEAEYAYTVLSKKADKFSQYVAKLQEAKTQLTAADRQRWAPQGHAKPLRYSEPWRYDAQGNWQQEQWHGVAYGPQQYGHVQQQLRQEWVMQQQQVAYGTQGHYRQQHAEQQHAQQQQQQGVIRPWARGSEVLLAVGLAFVEAHAPGTMPSTLVSMDVPDVIYPDV